MQRGDHPGLSAEVFGVGQNLDERVAHGLEEQRGHHRHIGQPQRVEVMRQGENRVVVIAGQQPGALHRQPALGLEVCALRTRAMAAGVVPDAGHMPVGTGLDMASQRSSAALHDGAGGSADVGGRGMGMFIGGKRVLADDLEGNKAHRPSPTRLL